MAESGMYLSSEHSDAGLIYLDEEWRGKGKLIPRAGEAINLGFATDGCIQVLCPFY